MASAVDRITWLPPVECRCQHLTWISRCQISVETKLISKSGLPSPGWQEWGESLELEHFQCGFSVFTLKFLLCCVGTSPNESKVSLKTFSPLWWCGRSEIRWTLSADCGRGCHWWWGRPEGESLHDKCCELLSTLLRWFVCRVLLPCVWLQCSCFEASQHLFSAFVNNYIKMCLSECVYCEEESLWWIQIVLQDPELVFWSDERCFNVFQGFLECISHKFDCLLRFARGEKFSTKLLFLLTEGWSGSVTNVKGMFTE